MEPWSPGASITPRSKDCVRPSRHAQKASSRRWKPRRAASVHLSDFAGGRFLLPGGLHELETCGIVVDHQSTRAAKAGAAERRTGNVIAERFPSGLFSSFSTLCSEQAPNQRPGVHRRRGNPAGSAESRGSVECVESFNGYRIASQPPWRVRSVVIRAHVRLPRTGDCGADHHVLLPRHHPRRPSATATNELAAIVGRSSRTTWRTRRPAACAASSVRPTAPTCGSVKITAASGPVAAQLRLRPRMASAASRAWYLPMG